MSLQIYNGNNIHSLITDRPLSVFFKMFVKFRSIRFIEFQEDPELIINGAEIRVDHLTSSEAKILIKYIHVVTVPMLLLE